MGTNEESPHKGHVIVSEIVGAEWPEDLWRRFIGGENRDARGRVIDGVRQLDEREQVFPALVAVAMRALLDRIAQLPDDEFDALMRELADADDADLEAASKRLFRR